MTHNQAPVHCGEELSFEDVQLDEFDPADLGVVAVGTKGITESLGRDTNGCDEETVHCEGRYGETRHSTAHLVDII